MEEYVLSGLRLKFEEIKNTSGRIDKANITKELWLEDSPYFKRTITFLLDTFVVTNIATKKLNSKIIADRTVTDLVDLYEFFDYLEYQSTGKHEDVMIVNQFIDKFDDEDNKQFLRDLATKSYKLGLTAKTLNEIVGEEVLTVFACQLAKKYEEKTIKSLEKLAKKQARPLEFATTQKLDGFRCLSYYNNGKILFFSRQGKAIEGLNDLEVAVREWREKAKIPNCVVLDGELLSKSGDWSSTSTIVSSKSTDKKVDYHVFDWYNPNDMDEPYNFRRNLLDEWKQYLPENDLKVVNTLSYGNAEHCVNETAHLVTENGWEGVMLNYAHAPYELKRTNTLLKVKKFQTADLRIIGYFAGKGALSGMLGGFIVRYKGNDVEVGSGFKQSERIEFWKHKDWYIGKIIEVQYFEETTNQKDNTVSLRFPTFKRLRLDKDEVSYN